MTRTELVAAALRLRDARPGDLPLVLQIERMSFRVPWSDRAFRSLLGRSDARVIVAEAGGDVVGFAAVWFSDGQGELGDLAVDPDHRRLGVGRSLLQAAVEEARRRRVEQFHLQVRESNTAARRLYAAHGFRLAGRRERYYRDPEEDALVLSRRIRAPDASN